MHRIVLLAVAACAVMATSSSAQTILTLEDTIARARDRAGTVAIARARIAEAEAAALDDAARFRDNPVVDSSAGSRGGAAGRTLELEIGVTQQFETGGQRRMRMAATRATVERHRAAAEDAGRRAVFEAALAFVDGLAALERLRVAEESGAVSRDLVAATERRYAAGDIPAIDLNLARIEAARAAAALGEGRAELTRATGALRALLQLPDTGPIELRGTLDRPAPPALAALQAALETRPDFAALRAESREADAAMQLGRAFTRPDLGVRVAYEREESDSIVIGGLTVALPMFQKGAGAVARGQAQSRRLRLELETAMQMAAAELATAYAVHQQHREVAEAFARDALPGIADTESLARRSYDAGELTLMEFLLIRREALNTRTAVIAHQQDAARSALDLEFIAGVLR